ncbi:MAG: hypothetical protein DRO88_02845 [Promethearchaeia archaeon]|nr:MAG: hypothetical protein DRO88_02845 [Candidatus Lokiarchaeia archaeon]
MQDEFSINSTRFQKFFDYFPLPIVITDENGAFIYVNKAYNNNLGYSLEDTPNDQVWSMKAYPDIEYRKQILTTINKPGYNPYAPRERKIKCKNGEVLEMILQDIQIGNESLTFFRDITEQRKSERIARQGNLEYRTIVENLRDMIFLLDENLVIKRINKAGKISLGYSEKEMLEHSALDFISKKDHNLVQKMVNIKRRRKINLTLYEIDLLSKNNSFIPVEILSQIIDHDVLGKAILVIARDITQRKKLVEEKLRQKNIESIGFLAGGIAHDFNNILVSIMGNIDLLKLDENSFTQEQREILEDLFSATIQARDLVRNLMSFSKGGSPIRKISDLGKLIKETANFALRGSNCKLVYQIPVNLPLVDIDSTQISQVFHNLILNARQAMPNGGVITIVAKTIEINSQSYLPLKDGNYILISIRDTGVGISIENQSRIFSPYFTTKPNGTGLGLTMSYSIIKKHNGHITFNSRKDYGTEFNVYIPVSDVQVLPIKETQNKPKIKKLGKIAILDDEPSIHVFLKRILSKWGYTVDSFYRGEDLIVELSSSSAKSEPYSLIFMDLTIPAGLGGKETNSKIRVLYPNLNVVVFSGYSDDPVIANYRDYGFCDYMLKPFKIEELERICEKWIS